MEDYSGKTVTDQRQTCVPQFYLTPVGSCPYLPGRQERKIFARLDGPLAQGLNNALTQSGFRRSQTIAYKPSCEGCHACVSVRILVNDFVFSPNQRRVLRRGRDLVSRETYPKATREQYALLRTYLDTRHADGGMNDMSLFEYAAMVEETPVRTRIFEYRLMEGIGGPAGDTQESPLIATALTDVLNDGLSMVYSFFHPGLTRRSLGSFMILDHIRRAQSLGLPYVYLGYWVQECAKMRYKARFTPLETLTAEGWQRHDTPPTADQKGDASS
ncbi:MAG: arginyltransferase [Rhizomicrobium sp.]